VAPLAYRFDAAPHVALSARALAPLEVAEACDSPTIDAALVAASLVDARGRLVVSEGDLLHLTEREFAGARSAVLEALGRISPSYRLSDIEAWNRVLREGAAQHMGVVVAMGSCREAVGDRLVEAPEKFFGVARGALLDGHWMAFRAAQHVYEARRPKG
jgi:hypothetical protein